MFEDSWLSPSGIRIYTAVAHNVAGFDPTDTEDPHVRDALRKHNERGRAIQSENSEDALSWSLFHALSKLPTKDWLVDFFRAAVTERFARAYAPYVDTARVRFWVPHPSPKLYLQWLGAKVQREGAAAFAHLNQYDARIRAKKRLEKIMAGDPAELPEHPTEVDVEIRLGSELLVFIECKLYSDATSCGTFNSGRGQILRNLELLEDVARREGFKDFRFILLTLDRQEPKVYTQAMRRYRSSDMRRLRGWDELGNWEAVKADLLHRAEEPDTYFQGLTLKMGWSLWPEVWKLLAHYATAGMGPCRS